jgi:trehalose synthase
MLRYVDTAVQELGSYAEFVDESRLGRLRALARDLRGARILQLNATPYGGGVAELLNSLIPLERGLGLDVRWGVIVAEPAFFALTKRLHNALQGAPQWEVTKDELDAYLRHNGHVADAIRGQYDLIIVHDPQPAPVRRLAAGGNDRWIWRVHIDLSAYNKEAWAFLAPHVEEYEAFVFTLPEFVPNQLGDGRVRCFPPAIDPLSPKNMELPVDLRDRIVRWTGVQLDRPILTQVSRFDPWKDPLGVIRVYRQLREKHKGLQLVLLGSMALDDPEGWSYYERIIEEARDDPDIHVASNFTGIGNLEVNAFQSASSVVIQKSIREGFGLVVSETLWKGTPVVAGRTGGIPLQMADGEGGFLISREEDWVPRIDALLADREEARRVGALGRERVRQNFLITRLLEDELALMAEMRPAGM